MYAAVHSNIDTSLAIRAKVKRHHFHALSGKFFSRSKSQDTGDTHYWIMPLTFAMINFDEVEALIKAGRWNQGGECPFFKLQFRDPKGDDLQEDISVTWMEKFHCSVSASAADDLGSYDT